MTKMSRTSYFQHITRRPASNLPLLKPPHTPMRLWKSMATQDADTTQSLSAQRPSAVTTGLDTTEPSFQAPPVQHVTERQSKLPIEKIVEMEVVPGTIQKIPTPKPTPTAAPNTLPAFGESTVSARHKQSQTSRQLPSVKPIKPAYSVGSAIEQPSLVANAKGQTSASDEQHYTSITLRPNSRQEPTATRSKLADTAPRPERHAQTPVRPTQITIVPQSQDRLTVASRQQPQQAQQTQQETSIHIGTIDIHIVPPPAPPTPLPTTKGTTAKAQSTSALSREFTSFIGLRQG